ncbi:MAG: TonB-dependent receptor [Pseudomonadota bacterium]
MFNKSILAKSVRLACAYGAVSVIGATTPVFAQEPDAEEEGVEKIEVTGSRLSANANLAAASPILSVSGEEATARGNVRIEDFINVLPQVFAGQAAEVSNGSTGTATLDLRGLGAQRTLVLMDGRRLPYGSSVEAAANLDLIPTQMVERVDILTGGASAVYGSDAVSGVANFILDDDFEGVEVGTQFGAQYNDNDDDFWESVLAAGNQPAPGSTTDGQETLVYFKVGASTDDGRGNAVLFASFENRNEVVQRDRVFSACTLGQDDGENSFGGFGCVGSGNFRLFGGSGGFAFQEEDGEIVDFAGGPAQTFNFGAQNFFQRPSQRYQIFGAAKYEITDDLEFFANASYTSNTSDAQIAPSASFGGSWNINCGNPLIQGTPGLNLATDVYGCTPAQIANDEIVGGNFASHRNVEGGPRNSLLDNSSFRIITGLDGFIDDTWAYSAFVQVSESRNSEVRTQDFIVERVQQSFLLTTDADGNVVCSNPANGCVPYNIFQRGPNGESLVTQEALDFVLGTGLNTGLTKQFVYGADLEADLGDYGLSSPLSDAGVAVLLGYEFRRDELRQDPDSISQLPDGGFTGVGGPTLPVQGSIEVSEIFGELQIPIATDQEFIKELTLSAQYRYSDYDTDGNNTTNSFNTNAWGVSLTYKPTDDVLFRAGLQRAVRAPNVIELFEGRGTDLPNLSPINNPAGGQLFDPCATANPVASLEECARTGVTPEQFGTILDVISGQTQSITGGEPLLRPEESDTFTLGVVITPTAVEGLSISIDYFDIEIEDAIEEGIPAQNILNTCLSTGDPAFCDLITRAPSGTLATGITGVGFEQININIATLATNGFDIQALYRFDLGDNGDLNLDYAATILDEKSEVPNPGAATLECAGFFGNNCETVNPEYRHRFVATWTTPWDFDIAATWRYFGETDNDNAGDELESTLDAVNYFDITGTYYLNDSVQLRAGALNLLGEQPSIFSGAGPALGNGNTYPTFFDTGTTLFASVVAKF